MIAISRKELNENLKWSKTNSPIVYLVLSMNGKWGTDHDNPENIVSAFEKLWPAVRAHLTVQTTMGTTGKIPIDQVRITFPNARMVQKVVEDFVKLIYSVGAYYEAAEDYAGLESYNRDLLKLFAWAPESEKVWKGSVLYAMDKQGKYEEAFQQYQEYGQDEKIAGVYSLSVVERCDVIRAAEILDPFRGKTEDGVLLARIDLMDKLKAVKGKQLSR